MNVIEVHFYAAEKVLDLAVLPLLPCTENIFAHTVRD